MGYIACTTHIILLLLAGILQVLAITTRLDHEVSPSRNFRRHIGTLPFPDWELGLREAVYQALLRERNLHPNLREFLYSAPIIGHQDSATPFGDIVILARGQLYSAPGGFQFVQDPYKNDCDECHNAPPRCDRAPCENWRPEGHERLLALWTVKRIRHRDSNYGYRYELEYKVSPMNIPVDEPFVTRNGRFDYSMPGHTFIVKTGSKEYESSYQSVNSRHDKVYRSPNPKEYDSNSWSPNFGPNFEGRYLPPPPQPPSPPATEEYYDEDPRNDGYPNVLYGPPQMYTKKPPYPYYTTKRPQPYDDEEAEKELFKELFETLSSKTSTAGQAVLSTASTHHIDSPAITTKTSPQLTIPTTPQLPSKTTTSHTSYRPTSAQAPLLPTIPIRNSFDATDIFKENPLTTHNDEVVPTKPLSTIRFPTPVSSRSTTSFFADHKTTSTMRFPDTVRYSEPDPLYSNTVKPTRPTLTSKFYPTRTTKEFNLTTRKHKTTPSDDYDIFEQPTGTKKPDEQGNRMKFPGAVNIKQRPGEQVIKVVTAPTIIPKSYDEILFNTEPSQPKRPSPKYQVNFNNTQQLPPGGEPYITIGLHPNTRGQQSTSPTLNKESSSSHEFTTKPVVPQRTTTQQSSAEPNTPLTNNNVLLTTREYTTLNAASVGGYEETVTVRPFTTTMTKESDVVTSSTIQETVPLTTTPGKVTRTTIPPTTETVSSTYIIPLTSPPILTSPTLRVTKPISQSTRKYFPLTKATSTSTKVAPLTKITLTPTKTYFPSTLTTLARESPVSRKSTPIIKEKITPTKPATRKYKPPTQTITTIGEPRTYTTSTSSGTITNYPITDSIITSTFPSRNSDTTVISTTIKDFDSVRFSTGETTNTDSSTSMLSTIVPQTTHDLPKSTKPLHLPTINTKATLPVSYTTPPLSTRITTLESTTPSISSTSLDESVFPATHLTKKPLTSGPSRVTSSTTQATEDDFLAGNGGSHVSKTPKGRPQSDNLDLDIFGTPQEKVTPKSTASKMQHVESFNSKEIDDIFGSEPVQKQAINRDNYSNTQSPVSTTSNVKIIYSGFFSPSTSSSADKTTTANFNEEPESFSVTTTPIKAADSSEDIKNKTLVSEPLTSQSYSTSVSVEVNKRNEITTPRDDFRSNNNNDLELNSKETVLKKLTTQAPCNATEKHEEVENNKVLNMLTLSVVNHAKSIDILHSNNIDNNNNSNSNNSTNRERRYKRKRTYRIQKIRRHYPKT